MKKKGNLVHCSQECKLMQPVWKTVNNKNFKNLKIESSYNPKIPLLYIQKSKSPNLQRNINLIVSSSTIYNTNISWKQSKCPSTDNWIKMRCANTHTHTHTHTEWNISHKKNEIVTLGATQMDLENIMLCQINQRQVPYITYMWNLKKQCK